MIKDLTEKKKLEEDLKRAQAELVQTEKLVVIGRLASDGAHEMNDPFSSILTFGNLLREDTPEGEPNRESLDIIIKEAIRAKRIGERPSPSISPCPPSRKSASTESWWKKRKKEKRNRSPGFRSHPLLFFPNLSSKIGAVRLSTGA